jgi:predicted Zn-dependent protease
MTGTELHEIGHCLGLMHSDDPNTLMYPFFSPGKILRQLRANDVEWIVALYQ